LSNPNSSSCGTNRTMSCRVFGWLALTVAAAYGVQFVHSLRSKGQPMDLGVALLHLAAPSVRAANRSDGPKMNLSRVYGGPEQCDWWNFEQFWGRCATAAVDVLYEESLDSSAVRSRAEELLRLLAKPCAPGANSSNQLRAMIRCDTSNRPYRVRVVVRLVRAGPGGLENTSDLFAWNRVVIREFAVLSSKGEI
jgi:hypothetical protein